MTLPAHPVEGPLGEAGLPSRWVWPKGTHTGRRPSIPCGVFMDHGGHGMAVLWVGPDPADLVSLLPLTLAGDVRCPVCELAGTITDGVFLSAATQDGDQ